MKDWQVRISFVAVTVVTILSLWLHETRIREQQRQIDQLCEAMQSVIWDQAPFDQKIGSLYENLDGEYRMYFADYGASEAYVENCSPDATGHYTQPKIRLIHVLKVPQDILMSWRHGEVRKLPLTKE